MSDLRDRITAAIKAEAELRGIYRIADFDFPFLADAVIAELGLREQTGNDAAYPSVISCAEYLRTHHRYVTDWQDCSDCCAWLRNRFSTTSTRGGTVTAREPETWLGNIQRAACRTCGSAGYCHDTSRCFQLDATRPRTACTGCGLPLPHAAGECKRGDR